MTEFLNQISAMLVAAPVVAVSAAFLWGLASVVLSPCHLISVPLLIGYLNDRGESRPSHTALLPVLFAAGILVIVGSIGIATALAGRMLGDIGPVAEYVVGALLVLFGLHLAGFLRLPSISTAAATRIRGSGGLAVFLMGLIFGVGLGPCTFAFMAPVLVLVLSSAAEQLWFSAALLVSFAVGHSTVIIGAGSLSQAVRRFLNWDSRSQGTLWVRRACGILVAAGGVYLIAV